MEAPFRCLDEFDVFMVSNCHYKISEVLLKSFSLFVVYFACLSEVRPNRTPNALDFLIICRTETSEIQWEWSITKEFLSDEETQNQNKHKNNH